MTSYAYVLFEHDLRASLLPMLQQQHSEVQFWGREAGRISSKLPLCPLSVDNSIVGTAYFLYHSEIARHHLPHSLCYALMNHLQSYVGSATKMKLSRVQQRFFRWMNFSPTLRGFSWDSIWFMFLCFVASSIDKCSLLSCTLLFSKHSYQEPAGNYQHRGIFE